ncbi:MAG: hypothetical protein ACTHNU_05570 [Gaiellales bacterium]
MPDRMNSHADGDLVYDDGVDRTIWQARLEDIEPDLQTTPTEALPELARLIREMEHVLGAAATRSDEMGDEDSADVLTVADRIDGGEPVSREEVDEAVEAGVRLAWYLVQDRRGPDEALEEDDTS